MINHNDNSIDTMNARSSFDVDLIRREDGEVGLSKSDLSGSDNDLQQCASPLPSAPSAKEVMAIPSFDGPPSALGSMSVLPRELRDTIYRHIVIGSRASPFDWGRSSGINTALLQTSKAFHAEATEQLYNTTLIILVNSDTCSDCPPASALARMVHLTIEVTFRTHNRGESQVKVHDAGKLKCILEYIALPLRRNHHLKDLQIVLLNEAQRKRGQRPVRAESVTDTVRGLLKPFAALPLKTSIEISGFDTLEYAQIFDELRSELAGTDIPVEELCDLI